MTYCRDLADHKWRVDDAVEELLEIGNDQRIVDFLENKFDEFFSGDEFLVPTDERVKDRLSDERNDERLRCLAWIDTIRGAFSTRDITHTVLGNLRKEIERGNEPPQKVMKI